MGVFIALIIILFVGAIIYSIVKSKREQEEISEIMEKSLSLDKNKIELGRNWIPNDILLENESNNRNDETNVTGAKRMLVLGSIMTIGGTISAVYGNYQNNHVDAQRFYDAAQDFWYNGTVDRNPGDPFFIAGLVVLGVGALLLVGGVVWLIIAKNKSE